MAESETYGSATSSVRTPQDTDVALFWEPAINLQYTQIVRAIIADIQHSLAWDTRFVAAFQVITTDAQIAIYNAKYRYVFWRPVTAIRDGSPDNWGQITPEVINARVWEGIHFRFSDQTGASVG